MSKKRKNRKNRKSHMGSSIDDFLKEEGIFEETQAHAVKEKYPKTRWPHCLRPAAPRLTVSLIRKTTSRFPACNGRQLWLDGE